MNGVTLFICGQPLRGDDGAALSAVRALPPQALLAVRLREVGELGVEDLLSLAPGSAAIVVDAVAGVAPGRLVCFDLTELASHAGRVRPHSTHQLPLDQVVGMAQLLGASVRGSFIGVGGIDFGYGQALSPAVRRALPGLRAALIAEIALLSRPAQRPAQQTLRSLPA